VRSDNPPLIRLYRSGRLESVHRGAWALVDLSGTIIDGAGDPYQSIFPRSASKSLQALPLVESGAADRFGFDERHLALALASHSGEPIHVQVAADGLARLGLDAHALRCGPQRPAGAPPQVEAERIANNCSGKHVGFLAVAVHLDTDPSAYLDPGGAVQQRVRTAVQDMTDTPPEQLGVAIDGCSAPTFQLPLASLALGLARMANPDGLPAERAAACRRLTSAARAHPDLIAGTHERFCTDIVRATNGRVFAKIGAEGVYAFGVVDHGLGFAGKVDDGNARGLYPLMIDLLVQHHLITGAEAAALDHWGNPTLRNWDGLEVGHTEICHDERHG
jgi:L-asparaginase II